MFDEDTGAIHHDLKQCRTCKNWHNHFMNHRDTDSPSWVEADQSRFDKHCGEALSSLHDSDGYVQLAGMGRTLEKIQVDLSTIKERDKFQYLQFKWLKKQNVIIDQECEQAKQKCEEMEEKISTLNREVLKHKWGRDHLRWRLENAEQELKNINQELKNANQELENANRKLEDANRELEKASSHTPSRPVASSVALSPGQVVPSSPGFWLIEG